MATQAGYHWILSFKVTACWKSCHMISRLFVSSCLAAVNDWTDTQNKEQDDPSMFNNKCRSRNKSYTNRNKISPTVFQQAQAPKTILGETLNGSSTNALGAVWYFFNPELNYDLHLEDNWSNRGKSWLKSMVKHPYMWWCMLYGCHPSTTQANTLWLEAWEIQSYTSLREKHHPLKTPPAAQTSYLLTH